MAWRGIIILVIWRGAVVRLDSPARAKSPAATAIRPGGNSAAARARRDHVRPKIALNSREMRAAGKLRAIEGIYLTECRQSPEIVIEAASTREQRNVIELGIMNISQLKWRYHAKKERSSAEI